MAWQYRFRRLNGDFGVRQVRVMSCIHCKGTGKILLLYSYVDCECIPKKFYSIPSLSTFTEADIEVQKSCIEYLKTDLKKIQETEIPKMKAKDFRIIGGAALMALLFKSYKAQKS